MRIITKRQECKIRSDSYFKGYEDGADFMRGINRLEKAQIALALIIVGIVIYAKTQSEV